jgi:IclR family acetate operon transcriptional repressor
VPSTHALKMASEVGERTLVHVSALGKCLIAWDGPERLDAVMAGPGLPGLSPRTLTTRAAFEEELATVRAQGYALDDEESLEGLRCVGAPVRGVGSSVIGAISVSGPVDRVSRDRLPQITASVVAAAERVSRQCGWTP